MKSEETKKSTAKKKTKKTRKKRIKKNGIIFVDKQFKNLHERNGAVEQELLPVRTFDTMPACAGQERGLTMSIGGYDNIKVRVWCEVPCYKEELEDALDYCEKICEERIKVVVNEVKGNGKSTSVDMSEG